MNLRIRQLDHLLLDGDDVSSGRTAFAFGVLFFEVIAALREISDLLGSLAQNLEEQDEDFLIDFLTRAKEHREHLPLPNPQFFLDAS